MSKMIFNSPPTSASCCLLSPPLRRSSIRLPTRGQLVGPGIASKLCALEAAWGHRAASTASFCSRTHTEDVGLKCCSPTVFFFSSSTIWGTFWICALILSSGSLKSKPNVLVGFFFSSIRETSCFLELSHFCCIIYPESVYSCQHRTNQGSVLMVWLSSPPFIYGSYDPWLIVEMPLAPPLWK